MKKTPIYLYVLGLLITGVGLSAALWTAGWLFRPDVSAAPATYSPQQIQEARQARDVRFDPKNPPVLHQDVDYGRGRAAAWYPKGESPILEELVREGKLPPVAQRVGGEPCVMAGVEGVGNYGGTWLRVATTAKDVGVIADRMSYASLLRWSPLGYPIRPHVAKSVTPSADRREFVVTLRKGIRWSDGHPVTADDIMYWWNHERNDRAVYTTVPEWMKIGGKVGTVEEIDDLRVRFRFPAPHGLFLEALAQRGAEVIGSPVHFLRKYHPTIGDKKLIAETMTAYKLPSPRAVYTFMKHDYSPDIPRLWPWIYRTHKSNPPQVFVRNPYYFVVDSQGNQLPYVDRVQFDVQSGKMLALSAINGKITMQTRHIRYADYTELMARRTQSGTRILHWYPATRSVYVIHPNLNRRVDPARPETKHKARLLFD